MYNKKLLITFIISLFFLTTMFSFNTVNAEEGDVTLVNWDGTDGIVGLTSGTVENIVFNGGIITTKTLDVVGTAPRCWEQGNGATINLTDSYSYISFISIAWEFYVSSTSSFAKNFITFKNNTDTVLDIRMGSTTAHTSRTFIVDAGSNEHELVVHGGLSPGVHQVWLNITHISGNTMNYTLEGDISSYYEGGSAVASTWNSFNQIFINTAGSYNFYFDDIIINTVSEGSVGGGDDEFSNLILESPPCGVLGSMPMMRYFEWWGQISDTKQDSPHCIPFYCWDSIPCPYIEMKQTNKILDSTIYYVDLFVDDMQETAISGSLADYSCRVNNNPFTFMGFTPKTIGSVKGKIMRFGGSAVLTNQSPLICFYSSQSFDDSYGNDIHWCPAVMSTTCGWDSRKHDISADYTDGQLDGVPFNNQGYELSDGQFYFVSGHVSPYVQYWYSGGITEYMPDEEPPSGPEEENYTAKYGESFIEFWENDDPCRYGIGSYPVIIYHLNDSMMGLYRTYKYEIVNSATEEIEMTGSIVFPDNVHDKYVILTHSYNSFSSIGQYYIRLWNLTTNHVNDAIVEESQTSIVVCEESYLDIDIPIDVDNVPSVDKAIKGLPVYAKVIFALFLIIIITMSPYAITVMISKTNIHVEIPSLLYVAFFFTGIIASVALGLLEMYVFFIVLIGLIITFAILWLQGKKIGGEE